MAEGQMRSNKEARKPKTDKSVQSTVAPRGSQVKFAAATGQKK